MFYHNKINENIKYCYWIFLLKNDLNKNFIIFKSFEFLHALL